MTTGTRGPHSHTGGPPGSGAGTWPCSQAGGMRVRCHPRAAVPTRGPPHPGSPCPRGATVLCLMGPGAGGALIAQQCRHMGLFSAPVRRRCPRAGGIQQARCRVTRRQPPGPTALCHGDAEDGSELGSGCSCLSNVSARVDPGPSSPSRPCPHWGQRAGRLFGALLCPE